VTGRDIERERERVCVCVSDHCTYKNHQFLFCLQLLRTAAPMDVDSAQVIKNEPDDNLGTRFENLIGP